MNRPPFFVALDLPSAAEALEMAAMIRPVTNRFKVGLELYTAEGPEIVRRLTGEGDEVFLDLKLHDIPRTAERAVRIAARIGVSWLTVHASGARTMLEEAARASEEEGGPKLLAVTVLTSLNAGDLEAIGMAEDLEGQVRRLGALAISAGIHGLICSPREVRRLRKKTGPDPLIVTPGVRPPGSVAGDQKRVATPEEALNAGADLLVIGRPITADENPGEAALRIADGIAAAVGR